MLNIAHQQIETDSIDSPFKTSCSSIFFFFGARWAQKLKTVHVSVLPRPHRERYVLAFFSYIQVTLFTLEAKTGSIIL